MVDHLFSDVELAALYDAFCEGRNDFDFYLPLIMSAKTVLDVGCGTGELLHRARMAGHAGRLCGLDPAVGMLQQARKRSDIEWVLGDLASVSWEHEFDLIVMTGNAFQVLVEDNELRAALAAVRSALAKGGRFAFETRNPLAREWEGWTPDISYKITDGTGAGVRMIRNVVAPFDGNVISFTHTFTSPSWERPKHSQSTLRFVDAEALGVFQASAGLAIEQQFGDFDRQPLSNNSLQIITIARQAYMSRP